MALTAPAHVEKLDVSDFLSQAGRSGTTRARKLAAVRTFFRFLVVHDYLAHSPADGVATPHKERHGRSYLRTRHTSQ